jgi:hypothetical protein
MSPRKRKRTRDPEIIWDGEIASRDIAHGPKPVPYIRGDKPRPVWITHYLCVLHELDEKRSKSSGLTIIKRKWYLTIDGTSRTFIPEHEALSWLLSKASTQSSSVEIINLSECDLIRMINLG